MTPEKIDELIKAKAHEYLKEDSMLNCDFSYAEGANLLKPALIKALEALESIADNPAEFITTVDTDIAQEAIAEITAMLEGK